MRAWLALYVATLALPVVVATPPPATLELLAVAVPGILTYGAEGSPPTPLPAGAYDFAGQVANGACPPGSTANVVLFPASGVWTVPMYVWRHHASAPLPPLVEHMTFYAQPVHLRGSCDGAGFRTDDLLLFPSGHAGQAFTATLSLRLVDGSTVADADAYPG